jgi:hypothetical protein
MAKKYPDIQQFISHTLASQPELTAFIHNAGKEGHNGRLLASVLNETNFRRVLAIMLDENEFLGDYGIRALSKIHKDHPFVFYAGNQEYKVNYMPGESGDNMFGGNSNWRGPIWMPVNMLIVRALLNFYLYYGKEFTIECPTGSGNFMNLYEVAQEISRRLTSIFLKDAQGNRPVNGTSRTWQEDPHWKEYLQFHEYFHGDSGRGIGASHQTGWTGVIARMMHLFALTNADAALGTSKSEVFKKEEGK